MCIHLCQGNQKFSTPKLLKNECCSSAHESLNTLGISHGIALSFFDKIADYLNRENAADLIYLNLTKILDVVSPREMISYAGENGD